MSCTFRIQTDRKFNATLGYSHKSVNLQSSGLNASGMLNPWVNNYHGFGISPDTANSPSHNSTPQRRDSLNSDPRLIGYGLQQVRNPHNLLYNGITSPGPGQGNSIKIEIKSINLLIKQIKPSDASSIWRNGPGSFARLRTIQFQLARLSSHAQHGFL